MNNKTKVIFILIALAILISIFYFAGFFDSEKTLVGQSVSVATSTVDTQLGGAKIEQVPIEKNEMIRKMPSLDRPIKFSDYLDISDRKIIEEKINRNIANLRKNSQLVDEWISLGINRKFAGDYEGAKEVWEYAGYIGPNEAVTFSNLGDLYGYYLKDKILAEKNFLRAIEVDKNFTNYYLKTADFYREVMGDKGKARAVLEKGLMNVPNDPNLIKALEQVK